MTVKQLVDKYNQLSSEQLKENLVKSIILRTYAPVLEKKLILDTQFEKCLVEQDGIKYVDRFLAGINMVFAILALYTNLELADKKDDGYNTFDEYDLLMESRIFDLILVQIGEREMTELMNINHSIEESFDNLQTVEAYIGKQVTRFAELFGTMVGSGADQLADVLNDEKKVNSLLVKIKDAVGKIGK